MHDTRRVRKHNKKKQQIKVPVPVSLGNDDRTMSNLEQRVPSGDGKRAKGSDQLTHLIYPIVNNLDGTTKKKKVTRVTICTHGWWNIKNKNGMQKRTGDISSK